MMNAFLEPTPMPEDLTRALTLIHSTVWAYDLYASLNDRIRGAFLDALETVRCHLVGIKPDECPEDISAVPHVRGEGWSL